MKENSNSAGSDQSFKENAENQRERELLKEKEEFKRKKFLSSEAWETIAQVRYWAEKHWNKGIKEKIQNRFEITTKVTPDEKQICIKPTSDCEHQFVMIKTVKSGSYTSLVSALDSWLLAFHDDDNPTEKFDLEINDNSIIVKADISEYHDKCYGPYKQLRDQERSVLSEVVA